MLDRQGIPGKYSSTTNFLSIGKIPFLVKELRGQILCNPHKTESVARVVYPPHNADHKGSVLSE